MDEMEAGQPHRVEIGRAPRGEDARFVDPAGRAAHLIEGRLIRWEREKRDVFAAELLAALLDLVFPQRDVLDRKDLGDALGPVHGGAAAAPVVSREERGKRQRSLLVGN